MPTKVIMPQLGESIVEGTVTKWLKSEGEAIQEMDSLLEVNTDKVDTEIPSPASGRLLKILVPEGVTVRAGTVIAWIGQPEEALPGEPEPGSVKKSMQPEQAPEISEPGAQPAVQAIEETVEQTRPVPTGQGRDGLRADGGKTPAPVVPPPGRSRELGFISPIVARLAQENHVDLAQVAGTGENGRITKKDVLAYLEQLAAQPPASGAEREPAEKPVEEAIPAPWETPADGDLFRPTEMVFGKTAAPGRTEPVRVAAKPAQPQPVEPVLPGESGQPQGSVIPLSPVRRKIAERMLVSKRTSPHVTTVMEADLHRMIAHYQANKAAFAQSGVKLTYTAYFAAAAIQALRAFPMVNSSWTEDGIQLHPNIHLGMAVALGEEGLIVPVIKNAGELSLQGLARAIGDLAARARDHRLQPQEVRDGTFTITNHGISGSLFATPIINQPQCAILGVGMVQKRVVVIEDDAGGDTIAIRPMVYLSLTFDHRILDGASADGFLSRVVQELER